MSTFVCVWTWSLLQWRRQQWPFPSSHLLRIDTSAERVIEGLQSETHAPRSGRWFSLPVAWVRVVHERSTQPLKFKAWQSWVPIGTFQEQKPCSNLGFVSNDVPPKKARKPHSGISKENRWEQPSCKEWFKTRRDDSHMMPAEKGNLKTTAMWWEVDGANFSDWSWIELGKTITSTLVVKG